MGDFPSVAIPEAANSAVNGVVSHPIFWAGPGADYWLGPGIDGQEIFAAAAATNPAGLDAWGWTITGSFASPTAGGGGDFLSAADPGTPYFGIVVTSASAQHFWSPQIFGDYNAGLVAERFLGAFPTKLTVEIIAIMGTVVNNEPGVFFGIARGAPVLADASGCVACIYSNGANWVCAGDTNSDTGAAVDTSAHRFRIELTSGQVEWFIDDVSQGTYVIDTDTFPVAIGARRAAALSNQLRIAQIRAFYS